MSEPMTIGGIIAKTADAGRRLVQWIGGRPIFVIMQRQYN